MECCILCLEINKEVPEYIVASSDRWQELCITNILEKHFWPMSNIQPCSRICLACWQEIENFHKFYLRIEEAQNSFGRVKIEGGTQLVAKAEISEEIQDFSYLEPEMLKVEVNDDYLNENTSSCEDPLQRLIIPKQKGVRTLENQTPFATKSCLNTDVTEVVESTSDITDTEQITDDEDCNYNSAKNTVENKNRKEGDKFIAEYFKQMFCDLCDVPFENFTAMKKHFLMTHSIPKGYLVCCSRKFTQRNHLVDHLQCHLNPDHFKCEQCGKTLSDRKNLQGHMLRVHRPKDIAPKHSCDICGKSFIMAYLLRAHKLKHLPKEERKFPCTQCGKLYASSYLLKIHTEVIHLKKIAKVCYICGKAIRTSKEYKSHMDRHKGNNDNALNCDVCGLRLISERSLKLHKESQHPEGGKQDHPCPICDKVSPTARALKKHITTMHEKGCDHKCTICEKAFRRPEALKEHMASHTGTPLYACPWCPKTFNSNGNMHAHRKSKHPKESLELKRQKYN